ncbi:MAG: peroxidase [Actinomycetota bacterium]|nr:peroxidase [Actinomycetota bacterium]
MAGSVLSRAFLRLTEAVDRRVGWHRLPRPLGILTLIGIRDRLRHTNLYDTGPACPPIPSPPEGMEDGDVAFRTLDGTFNDLDQPAMGSIGCRFGRNVPLQFTRREDDAALLTPNPRTVSRRLMTREHFQPATTLNVLAAAWIQFEVHDWFSHGKPVPEPWRLPLEDDDPWLERPMRIMRTRPDPEPDPNGVPNTFVTTDTHWWDASQIYGNTREFAAKIRSGEDGKLRIGADGLPPADLQDGLDLEDVAGAFWLGLALLHTLFMLEHNAICDRIKAENPTWSDERIFAKARLVNAALMAKIHTVEWTPAIIAHPTTELGMRINWWGLVGEQATKRFGRLSPSEVLSGIPGSPTSHHGVPYSLTEEFVAVYRMHPLIPDEYVFRSAVDDQVVGSRTFPELGVREVRRRLDELGMVDSLYSFGIAHPGAITLNNYPRFLQEFQRPAGDPPVIDLAATDILRSRERGVPRYNQFRRLFHLKPVETFEELTRNPGSAAQLREVYDGDVERVDLMVGLYAEPAPKGFGFSDTAFRVFILMATRRLKSDRFFTKDYRPEVYTRAGLDWIDDNNLSTVLLRHFPELGPALQGVDNAFRPWTRVR